MNVSGSTAKSRMILTGERFPKEYLSMIFLGIVLGALALAFSLKTVLILFLGGITFVLILGRPEIGFLLMVTSIFLESAVTLLPREYLVPMTIAKLLGLLTLISWVLNKMVIGRSREIKPMDIRLHYIILAGLGLTALVSFCFAVNPQEGYAPLAYNKLGRLIALFALYFLTVNIVSSTKFLQRVISLLVVSSSLIAFFSVIQRYVVPKFRTEIQVGAGAVIDPTEPTLGSIVRGAAFAHPDILAVSLLMVAPLIIYRFHFAQTIRMKLALGGALAITLMGLVFTGSRAGVLGLIFMLLWMFFRKMIRISPKIFILSLILVLSAYIFTPSVYWERFFSIRHYKVSENIKAREKYWQASFKMIRDHPITGIGINNFGFNLPFYSKELAWYAHLPPERKTDTPAHNLFLELATEQGILGLFFLLIFLGLTFKDFERVRRTFKQKADFEMFLLSTALETSLVGFLFWSLAHAAFLWKPWWLVAGLAPAMRRISLSTKKNGLEET